MAGAPINKTNKTMKKLILMLLVLVGGVMQASAVTIYVRNNCNWGALYLYAYNSDTDNNHAWPGVELSTTVNIDGKTYFTADIGSYASFIIHNNVTGNSDNTYNERAAYLTSNVADGTYYYFQYSNEGWSGSDHIKWYNLVSDGTVHSVKVKVMQTTTNAPKIHTWDGTDDSDWPGHAMSAVTAEENTYEYKTLQTSFKGCFNTDEDNDKSGDITFNLSEGDVLYNYYPANHQAVLASVALASPAKIFVRSNYSGTLKINQWTPGIYVPQNAMSTEEYGGYVWYVFTSYSPTINATFRTYWNSNTDSDDSWGNEFTLNSGESTFYFVKAQGGVLKLESSYYLVYSNGWHLDPDRYLDDNDHGKGKENVRAVQLTVGDNAFEFKGELDNTTGEQIYYAIVPASQWSSTNVTGDWNNVIYPSSDVTDSKYTIDDFAIDECDVLPATWNRWYVAGVDKKFNVSFNFATMKWKSTPYFTKTIKGAQQGGKYYATFSNSEAVAIPSGITAFYAASSDDNKVTMTKIDNGIPANTGVFLEMTEENAEYTFTPATTTGDVTGNLLVAGTDAGVGVGTGTLVNYVLSKQSNVVGFYKIVEGKTITSDYTGKAYLQIDTNVTSAPMLSFDFGEGTTGINDVRSQMEEAREGIFDLQGRRVENPTKGLYIVNGKKVFIK